MTKKSEPKPFSVNSEWIEWQTSFVIVTGAMLHLTCNSIRLRFISLLKFLILSGKDVVRFLVSSSKKTSFQRDRRRRVIHILSAIEPIGGWSRRQIDKREKYSNVNQHQLTKKKLDKLEDFRRNGFDKLRDIGLASCEMKTSVRRQENHFSLFFPFETWNFSATKLRAFRLLLLLVRLLHVHNNRYCVEVKNRWSVRLQSNHLLYDIGYQTRPNTCFSFGLNSLQNAIQPLVCTWQHQSNVCGSPKHTEKKP